MGTTTREVYDGEGNLVSSTTIDVPDPPLNTKLETAFMAVLPKHMGQPYLTPPIITSIMQTKVAVTDANTFDTTGTLGKAIVSALMLPQQMQADQQAILALFP